MLGEKELNLLFPDFKKLVQPAGIDLRVDKVYKQVGPGSLVDDDKTLQDLEDIEHPLFKLQATNA